MAEKNPLLRRLAPLLLLAVLIPVALWIAVKGLGGQADTETLRLTEQSVRRAAVQCYALEGFYPTDLEYLRQNYGVDVDEGRCFVDYRYVAANLMPDITVLPAS